MKSKSKSKPITHRTMNHKWDTAIPMSDKAVEALEALDEIDDLQHEYADWDGAVLVTPLSVRDRVSSWLENDIFGPGKMTEHGPAVPGYRAQCLEAHPALAVYLAVDGNGFRGAATKAFHALDAGKSIEEVARIARFHVPADTDPRRLRVRKAGKGKWNVVVVGLHPNMRNEKVAQPKKKRK